MISRACGNPDRGLEPWLLAVYKGYQMTLAGLELGIMSKK